MTFHRLNVHELGGDWAAPILWYARGVKAMQAKGLDSPTSWRFYAAIHGMVPDLWEEHGAYAPGEALPTSAEAKSFWNQCQHGSWYFLPWHRGYLLAFEAIVRAEIVALGGDSDWALPYWNYFKAGQGALPPEFASQDWPDGTGDNPLYEPDRFGPDGDGNVFVDLAQVDLDALGDGSFTSAPGDPTAGFGGVMTGFSHGGGLHGGVESQPHDVAHGLIGGQSQATGVVGLMSDPDTAGLDPIFWLHHCNIDRLWEVWRKNPTTNLDPADDNWKKGPAVVGEPPFTLPMAGGTAWTYTPEDMSDMSALGYDYDDLSPPPGVSPAVQAPQGVSGQPAAVAPTGTTVNALQRSELIGANAQSLSLVGSEARTSVKLAGSGPSLVASARGTNAGLAPSQKRRFFLNLENVRSSVDSPVISVYLNVPTGADVTEHPELRAGSFALFGVRKASVADGEHAGDGLTYVIDVTRAIEAIGGEAAAAPNLNDLEVRLVPRKAVAESANVTVGRISLYAKGS